MRRSGRRLGGGRWGAEQRGRGGRRRNADRIGDRQRRRGAERGWGCARVTGRGGRGTKRKRSGKQATQAVRQARARDAGYGGGGPAKA